MRLGRDLSIETTDGTQPRGAKLPRVRELLGFFPLASLEVKSSA